MKTCETCKRTEETGFFPGPGQHCEHCHQTVVSPNYSHCGGFTGCHRWFASDHAFDAHLGPGGICRDPSSLKNGEGEARFRPVERQGATVWQAVRFLAPDHGTKAAKAGKPRIAPHREDAA